MDSVENKDSVKSVERKGKARKGSVPYGFFLTSLLFTFHCYLSHINSLTFLLAGGHNSQQTGQKTKLPLEIGAAGGGFVVLLLFMLVGCKIQQYCYRNQPALPPPHPPVQKDYGTFMPKTIPYEEIENIRQ